MDRKQATRPPWTIVLAAGEGTRLRTLSRALHGEEMPKQFANIHGGVSLLEATLARVRRWSPPERTVIVVAKEREALARSQVEPFGAIDVVAQPRNLGTGPGLLLPLMRVLARDPSATVVSVPSDHYVRDIEPFVDSIARARAAALASNSLVLIGAVPERAEAEYGWIVAGPEAGVAGAAVERFEEKPPARLALELFAAGGLWNTFALAGSAERFWQLGLEHLPEHGAMFASYASSIDTAAEQGILSRLYERMPYADFSRDVLHRAAGLRAVTLTPCGWSDWGTPERIFDSLRGSEGYDRLMARVAAQAHVNVRADRDLERTGPARRLAVPNAHDVD